MDYNDIEQLIKCILIEYNRVCKEWEDLQKGNLINLKRKLVKDVRLDNEIFVYISGYRAFLSSALATVNFDMSNVSSRIKAQNSLESKIQRYIDTKEEHGETPINKCVNDLFGVRIVCKENIIFDDFKKHIYEMFKLKCIDASKDEYLATHIYFKRDNNSFPWELQVWEERNRESNLISHHKYKQDYASWEKEAEGGET